MEEIRPPLKGPEKLTIWNRNYICVFMAQAFMSLSQQSVNILIARYARESLGVSDVLMGNLVGLYYGVSLAMRPIAGPMQAKLNKRNLLIGVYLTAGIVNLGYAVFNTTAAFITFRVLQGVQYAFMGSLVMIIAVDSLPKEKMASGVAMYGLGGTVMQTIAPNIGLWLRDLGPQMREGAAGVALGYRLAFFFAAGALVIALIPLFLLKYEPPSKEELAASTGAWYKNIISVHTIPIALVVILTGMAASGYRNYIDAFANEVGISNIGLFATVTAIVMMITRPLTGRIMDRHGMKVTQPIGMVIIGAAIIVIANSRTLPMILVGALLSAFGTGLVTPGLHAMSIQTETPYRRAVASNTLFCGIDLGNYLGPVYGGVVVSSYSFSTAIMAGLIPLTLAFILFLIITPGFTRRLKAIEEAES